MPRRRIACGRAIRPVVEYLENRTLLTTIIGGGTDPVTGQPAVTTRFYRDADDNLVRIDVGGNTTAEFIGGRVPDGTSRLILGDLAGTGTGDGYNLYNIYVSESDRFSFISITTIDEDTGDLLPFDGDIGGVRVRNATTGVSTVVPADGGTGTVTLGAITDSPSPGDAIPILSRSSGVAFGVRPASARIPSGLQIAPGNDFGKFLFGGTIIGIVDIGGSMDSFYAGNLFVGNARGDGLGSSTVSGGKRVANFNVGGNLHSLVVGGSIGTNTDAALDRPAYSTGFDMKVGGVLGQVAVRDAFMGGIDVIHGRSTSEFGVNIEESEGRSIRSGAVGSADETAGWSSGFLEGNNLVYNNDFGQPQILPSFVGRRGRTSVVATGQLVADPVVQDFVDYYAMPMLAGQDLTLTLRPTGTVAGASSMNIGVFDPDGRLILTDYANVDQDAVSGQPIHFTADRPGLFRFAIGVTGNGAFTNTGVPIGVSPYTLTINGGGDLPFGGVIATNQIFDAKASGYGFFVENGDMGALQAGGEIFSVTDQTINVRKGNLRSVEGASVGLLRNNVFNASPNLYVTRGNVGLIRSTAGTVYLNENVLPLAIGGDYQVVSAAGTLGAELIANRGIGVIRAGDLTTSTFASNFVVNADQLGDDGIIDLIDVTGDLGTLAAGGPSITTGPGGNVRYINVGGQVFRDAFFGGGTQEATTYNPGEEAVLTDDSGTRMEFEPFPVVPNPAFVPGGTNPAQIGPSLTITGYAIRGSGGLAIINVTSTGNVRIGAGGRRGSRAHAEVGLIQTTGTGNPVVIDPVSNDLVFSQPTTGTGAVNLEVLLDGSGTLDVYRVQATNATDIRNETVGEILNVNAGAGSIGSLSATNIGVGVSHTGAAVNGIQTIANNTYPFNQQHNAIVAGNILNVEASGAVGNIDAAGAIGLVTANSGGRNTTGAFEGIAGPIVAGGRIDRVNIGEGILPSGSGNFSKAGVYAVGAIGQIRNQGRGSNVRGDIISQSNIASVALSNGSIIGSRILVVGSFANGQRFSGGRVLPDAGDTVNNPTFEIGEISLGGYGGIIGTDIAAADVGDVTVARGFGIINSTIADAGEGTINSIYAEGYGIRGVVADGGSLLNSMKANAKPRNVSTAEYDPSVRLSEQYDIDPFFDAAPNRETDLHLYLGTSARRPQIKRVTDTGVIADTLATANRNAGTFYANQIRASQFNIANTISKITTNDVVDGLRITAGRLKSYTSGNSSFALDFNVAGVIDDLRVVGDLDETSNVKALGPAARIINFIVDGTMNGDVSSANNLHLLAIGKELGTPALVKAKSIDEQRIRGGVFGTIQIG